MKRLVRAARGFSHTGGNSRGSYDSLLSAWSRIFRPGTKMVLETISTGTPAFEAEFAQRFFRLKVARQNIRDWEARRLWQILLAHEVESLAQSEHIQDYTDRGVDANCAAKKMARKYLETTDVDIKRSAHTVHVIAQGGPASVLEFGATPPSM